MKNIAKALTLGATVVGTFAAAIIIGIYTNHVAIGVIVAAIMVLADLFAFARK